MICDELSRGRAIAAFGIMVVAGEVKAERSLETPGLLVKLASVLIV